MEVKLSSDDVKWFRETIDEMNKVFQDQEREDWWDGDDLAKAVADHLDDILIKAGA